MNTTLKIAVLPGDGIGTEVMPDHFDTVVGSNFWRYSFRLGARMYGNHRHCTLRDAHDSAMFAIEEVLRQGRDLTPDMGGKATTETLGKAIAALI